jgi:hypothetical protein
MTWNRLTLVIVLYLSFVYNINIILTLITLSIILQLINKTGQIISCISGFLLI